MNCLQISDLSARRLPACGYVTETGSSCRVDSTVSAAVAVVGVLRALMMESLSRTTWPAQPGRLVGSGSRLASFLPALPEGGAYPGPLPYRSFLYPPVVQGAGFELVESCGLCFFWLPYLLVLPCCCCCISPAGLLHTMQYNTCLLYTSDAADE